MVATLETVITPPATPSPEYVPTGPDVARSRAVRRFIDQYLPTPQRPVYDSVVIAGGKGITAYTLAARLARSPEFAGRVVVAGPAVEETRQLRNGVSMRGAAADFISYALACPQATFIRQVIGPQAAGQPIAARQTTAMTRFDPVTGAASFSRATAWQVAGTVSAGRSCTAPATPASPPPSASCSTPPASSRPTRRSRRATTPGRWPSAGGRCSST